MMTGAVNDSACKKETIFSKVLKTVSCFFIVSTGRKEPCRVLLLNDFYSVEIFAVGSDDLLVPEERILSGAGHGALAFIVHVDIDEAVAFSHFTGSG